ncbi:hypothetical protein AEAC466_16965 [Asticcacaulis sp. AC466]|uniref:hypothetical protein n=1 Tax=Asticcacaulis sp. AC466 TaxID=1282362 RepID=UPI0003C3D9DB|nr:hypothetical protein [Asticcacaulis sp. AC466]ESQ82557.1 hypothetical protein AEAC466_16965 [Asticcacaulis sp. AC466]
MTITVAKGVAMPSIIKPGDTELTDAKGVPFTSETRDQHGADTVPTGIDDTPKPYSGAGVDIDSTDMPDDGVIAVHDTDDDLLAEEQTHKISDIPSPDGH